MKGKKSEIFVPENNIVDDGTVWDKKFFTKKQQEVAKFL